MSKLDDLLDSNRQWATSVKTTDPQFFEKLAAQQNPEYLWIGCSDSRVPANQILGLMPGEIFVHRNVANLVVHTDLNCLTVLQYAVEVLQVKHVIVVGHYGCGGIRAAFESADNGLIDNWLRHIKDVIHAHADELAALEDDDQRLDALCEFNVKTQAAHVSQTPIVQNAWRRGQQLTIHGLVYSVGDGLLQDLGCSIDGPGQVDEAYRVSP